VSRGNTFGKLKLDRSLVWNDQPNRNRTGLLSRHTEREQDRDQYVGRYPAEICAEQGMPPLALALSPDVKPRMSSAWGAVNRKTLAHLRCHECSELHSAGCRNFLLDITLEMHFLARNDDRMQKPQRPYSCRKTLRSEL